MWNLKYDTNEVFYDTETDLQTGNRLGVFKWVEEQGIVQL